MTDVTAFCGDVLLTVPAVQPGWYSTGVTLTIELEREDDGRWVAEVAALPGVLCYGSDRDEAVARVQALALRVIAEQLEHREALA
jgi:predicted RNase H-like HicB family nuclease